jgi:uncharacterized protein YbaR (Trm112 family)
MNADQIAILRCPDNGSRVRLADAELISRLNAMGAAGRLQNRGGRTVDRALEGGLIREDRRVMYPIVDEIPVLLKDEGIWVNDE